MIVFNMSNILFIVGLPGSGKSTLARKINADNQNKYKIIDDPKISKDDIIPYLGKDLIITDPHLCFEKNRYSAIKLISDNKEDVKIDWIFFENDPDSCIKNSKNRKGKEVSSFIKNFSKFYTIPKNSTILSVYK